MKGILKKTAPGSSSGRRARWNEDNLEANEVIKSNLNPTKIDEPKTPYWSALDIDVGTSGASWTCDTQFADIEPLDLEDAEASIMVPDVSDGPSEVVPEVSKGDFSKKRLKHYDMKSALALGKKLYSRECGDDGEEARMEGQVPQHGSTKSSGHHKHKPHDEDDERMYVRDFCENGKDEILQGQDPQHGKTNRGDFQKDQHYDGDER